MFNIVVVNMGGPSINSPSHLRPGEEAKTLFVGVRHHENASQRMRKKDSFEGLMKSSRFHFFRYFPPPSSSKRRGGSRNRRESERATSLLLVISSQDLKAQFSPLSLMRSAKGEGEQRTLLRRQQSPGIPSSLWLLSSSSSLPPYSSFFSFFRRRRKKDFPYPRLG